tara:strand:- start:283 stop:456 length:174 start_codon:yes stop_codon:yes gene_type:complete
MPELGLAHLFFCLKSKQSYKGRVHAQSTDSAQQGQHLGNGNGDVDNHQPMAKEHVPF